MKLTAPKKAMVVSLAAMSLGGLIAPVQATEAPAEPEAQVASSPEVLKETDRLIVTYKDGVSQDEQNAVVQEKLESATVDGESLTNSVETVKESVIGDDSMSVVAVDEMMSETEQKAAIETLEADPRVESVEPDYIVTNAISATSLNPSTAGLQWGSKEINVESAWKQGATGKGVKIGIVDTGMVWGNPDIPTHNISGYDYISYTSISGDGNGRDSNYTDEADNKSRGHGQFINGLMTASHNSFGIDGDAPEASIFHARVLGGVTGTGYYSDIADGIRGSADNGVGVINGSLSWESACPSIIQSAISYAVSKNVPVIIAAGNNGWNTSRNTPANCQGVMAVAATTSTGALASFSNRGSTSTVVAPGAGIYSTFNSGYSSKGGTSFAAPRVASTVALMKSVNPNLSVSQVYSIIKETGRTYGSYKMVDAGEAVRKAKSLNQVTNTSGFSLYGGIGGYWNQNARTLGQPTSNEMNAPGNLGRLQHFANNYTVYWSDTTGARRVYNPGDIGWNYRLSGTTNGWGYPTSDEEGWNGGARQYFRASNGYLTGAFWTPQTGTKVLNANGGIYWKWINAGGPSAYGFPAESERGYSTDGAVAKFTKNGGTTAVYWSNYGTGSHAINDRGGISAKWHQLGGSRAVGYPVTDEHAKPEGGAAVYFRNSKGTETGIYWSPSTGSHSLNSKGALYYHWHLNGFVSKYGYPTTDEAYNPWTGKTEVKFSKGYTLTWTAREGVKEVRS